MEILEPVLELTKVKRADIVRGSLVLPYPEIAIVIPLEQTAISVPSPCSEPY